MHRLCTCTLCYCTLQCITRIAWVEEELLLVLCGAALRVHAQAVLDRLPRARPSVSVRVRVQVRAWVNVGSYMRKSAGRCAGKCIP